MTVITQEEFKKNIEKLIESYKLDVHGNVDYDENEEQVFDDIKEDCESQLYYLQDDLGEFACDLLGHKRCNFMTKLLAENLYQTALDKANDKDNYNIEIADEYGVTYTFDDLTVEDVEEALEETFKEVDMELGSLGLVKRIVSEIADDKAKTETKKHDMER
jgi:ATP:corrinoid adenosyltransferase